MTSPSQTSHINSNAIRDSDDNGINTAPLALPILAKSDQVGVSSVIPDPSEDCNDRPTTQLNFDAYATPDLEFVYNFDAAGMAICSGSAKDDNGNCPDSPKDTGIITGNMVIDSSGSCG